MTRLHHLGLSLILIASILVLPNSTRALPTTSSPDASPSAPFALYAQIGSAQGFLQLDPTTLTDLPNETPPTFYDLYNQAWSADGSVYITLENQKTIVVQDGPSGTEQRRFDAPEIIYLSRLSQDGSRLVVSASWECYDTSCDPPRHYTYDTRDGHLISKINGTGNEYLFPLIDRDAHILYAVSVDRDGQDEGSWPLSVTAYNLESGTKRDTITLPDILLTQKPTTMDDQVPIIASYTPAVTLSADGSRLAAIDAEGQTMTVVETASLTVTSHPLHQTESTLSRLARWVGVLPTTAEAKYMAGRFTSANFSPDSNFLYLWSIEGSFDDETGEPTGQGYGLTLVDVETGEIKSQAFAKHFIQDLKLAPDGLSLYVTETATLPWGTAGETPYTLYRLDPQTLEPLAERAFPSYVWIDLLPTYLPRDT